MKNKKIPISLYAINPNNNDYRYQCTVSVEKSKLVQLVMSENIYQTLINLNIALDFAKRFKDYKIKIEIVKF